MKRVRLGMRSINGSSVEFGVLASKCWMWMDAVSGGSIVQR